MNVEGPLQGPNINYIPEITAFGRLRSLTQFGATGVERYGKYARLTAALLESPYASINAGTNSGAVEGETLKPRV